MLSGIPCMLSPLWPWGSVTTTPGPGDLSLQQFPWCRKTHLLWETSHFFLWRHHPTPPPYPVPIPPWSCGLPLIVALIWSMGNMYSCPKELQEDGQCPHTVTLLCCVARTASLSYTQARGRQTSTQCPLSSPSHYHKAPHLGGSTQLGGRGIRGNTNNLVQKLFQFTTNHFKNSSNFHFLNIYTSRWGVRSHKIYFLLL